MGLSDRDPLCRRERREPGTIYRRWRRSIRRLLEVIPDDFQAAAAAALGPGPTANGALCRLAGIVFARGWWPTALPAELVGYWLDSPADLPLAACANCRLPLPQSFPATGRECCICGGRAVPASWP